MMKKVLIAIISCFFLTSISYGTFDMSALDTGYIDYIGVTKLSFIYKTINYNIRHKIYSNMYGNDEEKMKMRYYKNDVAPMANYTKQKNKKNVIGYIQALKKYQMNEVKALIDYSRNTGNNELLRFNISDIKPIIIGSGVLGFQSKLNGNGFWFYHFIQNNRYYTIYSKALIRYDNSNILYLNYSGNNILTIPSPIELSPETVTQYNINEVLNGTGLNGSQEYKIIKQSFDDFVKQINKMTKTQS